MNGLTRVFSVGLLSSSAWLFAFDGAFSAEKAAPPKPVSGDAGAKAGAGPAAGEKDENPHLWKPKTRSVAVFKNGLGFFMREGEVTLRDGWCVAGQVPPAAFGTLAIYAIDDKRTVDIVGSGPGEAVEFDGRDAAKDVATKRQRLEACKHLRVELRYQQKGEDRTASGKLISVGSEYVVLEADRNSFAVPLEGISRLQVLELPLRVHVASEGEKSPDTKLGMAYLRKGITWIPDYTLKIIDDENAELTLRGTIVNEAEDLVHTDVHLVVGVPHFTHTQFLAPLAVGQVIRSIGASVAGAGVPQQVTSQIMNRAAIVSNAGGSPQFDLPPNVIERPAADEGGDLSKAVGNLPQLGGAAATDYTVYTKSDLTLRRGEKAIVTLFTKKIKYGHVYRWSPPKDMEHSLVLLNGTDSAWTTGPCLALSGDSPLSEDLLRYTPKGGRGELPVTHAINIANDKSEREVDRQLKAHSPQRDVNFDMVTLEGKLILKNFEKRTAEVLISNPVPGKPTQADGKGTISINPTKLKLLEREGSVHWSLKLEPGEQRTLTYRYERFVPSN